MNVLLMMLYYHYTDGLLRFWCKIDTMFTQRRINLAALIKWSTNMHWQITGKNNTKWLSKVARTTNLWNRGGNLHRPHDTIMIHLSTKVVAAVCVSIPQSVHPWKICPSAALTAAPTAVFDRNKPIYIKWVKYVKWESVIYYASYQYLVGWTERVCLSSLLSVVSCVIVCCKSSSAGLP